MSENFEMQNYILDHGKDGVIIMDNNLDVTYANASAYEILKNDDLIGKKIHDVFRIYDYYTKELQSGVIEEVLITLNSRGLKKESAIKDFEDELHFVSASISPIYHESVEGIVIFFKDITKIKETESELIKFQKAFEESIESVIITNQNWKIEYCNNNSLRTREDNSCIKDKNFWDICSYNLSSDQKDNLINSLEEDCNWVGEIISNEGKWYKVSILVLKNIIGNTINFVISEVDITFEKESKRLLINERRNLSTIINGAPFGMMTVTKDFKILQINSECTQVLGVSLTKNQNVFELSSEFENLQFAVELVGQVLTTDGAVRNHEFMIYRTQSGNKRKRWIKANAVPIEISQEKCVLLSFEDETIKKEMARTIVRNERQLRMVTDNMQDIITQISLEGIINYCSTSYKSMLGYEALELYEKSLFKFIYSEDHEILRRMIEKCSKSKENLKFEIRYLSKLNQPVWVEIVMKYIINDNEEAILLFGRDVTQRRIAEQEIIHSKEIAIAANNAKSEFLANMSHEIRTPLNGIIGMANVSLMNEKDNRQKDNIQLIKQSAENLLKIINSVLDFSKIEAGKLVLDNRPFDLEDEIKRLSKPFKLAASQKEVAFNLQIDNKIEKNLYGDSIRLMQVLTNIIGNAIKFTEFGSVDFGIRVREDTPSHQLIEFIVKDTGIGIKDVDQNKIFRSFSQADGSVTRRFGGTGLGLNITKKIVELMQGEITFSSEYGKGTEFICTLPLKKSVKDPVDENSEKIVEADTVGLGFNILVVEDDQINQKLAQRLLKRKGYGITIVGNGQEAVDIYEDNRFDLILMDIQMPVLDGLQATELIREKARVHIPIIALTAYAIKGDREKFLKKGMDDYISKPIDLDEFYDILNKHLSKSKEDDQAIDKILERLGHKSSSDNNLVKKILDENFDKINMQLKYIDSSITKKNYEKLEERCYSFKNFISSLNLEVLRKHVFNLELYIRKENEKMIGESFKVITDYINGNSNKELKGVEHENSNR